MSTKSHSKHRLVHQIRCAMTLVTPCLHQPPLQLESESEAPSRLFRHRSVPRPGRGGIRRPWHRNGLRARTHLHAVASDSALSLIFAHAVTPSPTSRSLLVGGPRDLQVEVRLSDRHTSPSSRCRYNLSPISGSLLILRPNPAALLSLLNLLLDLAGPGCRRCAEM